MRRLTLLALLCAMPLLAAAQSVQLSGQMGNKALLVVDGQPMTLAVGQTRSGITLKSIDERGAVVEWGGRSSTLSVGGAPARVGGGAAGGNGGRSIVLNMGPGGHFVTLGAINGRSVRFMVDTGATTIGMGVSDAERIGLQYKQGQAVQVSTANGVVPGWKIRLSSVRLSDVDVRDIEAIITPISMPFVLLGNSYLTRFQMTRTNQQLVLEKRY